MPEHKPVASSPEAVPVQPPEAPSSASVQMPPEQRTTVSPPKAPVRTLRFAAVGDVMLGGSAAPEMAKLGYAHPFTDVSDVLQRAQIVFANLEGPLTDAGEAAVDKRYIFRSPPTEVASALAVAGINVVSLANNHILDYGVEGLKSTLVALTAAGIHHAGAGMDLQQARQPAIVKAGGYTVALLAYSLTFPESFWAGAERPGTAFGHERYVRADVASARERADIVVVSFHWGREATTELRDYQPRLAHAAIDAGAAVVLGHHPHILQGIERYKHGIIFYSLGNFAFGSYSRLAQRSVIAELYFENAELTQVRLIPLNVNNVEVVFQPRRLSARDAKEVIGQLRGLSAPLNTSIEDHDGIGVVSLSATPAQALSLQEGSSAGHDQ
jgi:poly-gamma-glutamate capsule biosynthesis protein CapA/YwtB (metallophosphatase superfamily)